MRIAAIFMTLISCSIAFGQSLDSWIAVNEETFDFDSSKGNCRYYVNQYSDKGSLFIDFKVDHHYFSSKTRQISPIPAGKTEIDSFLTEVRFGVFDGGVSANSNNSSRCILNIEKADTTVQIEVNCKNLRITSGERPNMRGALKGLLNCKLEEF